MDLQSRLNSSLVQSSTNQTVVDAYGLILMPLALQAGQENEVQKWQFRYHTFAILFVAGYVLLLALGYKLNKYAILIRLERIYILNWLEFVLTQAMFHHCFRSAVLSVLLCALQQASVHEQCKWASVH